MEYLDLSEDDGTSYLHLLRNRSTLWQLNNEPQYYEIKIARDNDEGFTKNMDEILNMNRLHCSICNLDVPKYYIKHHREGSIHQNFIKLTNKILERTKNHLLTNDESVNTSLHLTDTFFCNVCSKIVENKNMNDHSESELHKKHIVFEKLLKTFVEIFFEDGGTEQLETENLKEFINNKNGMGHLKTSDLSENISANLSEVKSTEEPVDSKDTEYTVNIFDPNYLKELLDSATDHPYPFLEPENSKTVENRDMLESSKMDPKIGPNALKDTKSGNSNIQLNSNSMDLIYQQNICQMTPNLNQINPMNGNWGINPNYHVANSNPMNHNLRPINPYFNPTKPNVTPMNPHSMNPHPNFNQMNPNLHNMYPNLNPNINNMNPNFNPNLNNMSPNFNPNFNNMNPYFNPMFANINTMTPNFNQMHPNINPMNPNFNQMHPNFNPMNPNFNHMNPNFNHMNPNFNHMHPNINPMDPRFQTNSNMNHMKYNLRPDLHPSGPRNRLDPNLNPTGLQNNVILKATDLRNKSAGNLNPTDPRNKSGINLNSSGPQPKLDPNLSAMDPKTELEANLSDSKPKLSPSLDAPNEETEIVNKTVNKAEKSQEKQLQQSQAFEEFSSSIKTIQEKYPNPGFHIEAVTVGKIKVTALNGDSVLVTKENFQSYNKKFCRVCQNFNLNKDHEMLEEHMSRIMMPVADKNCIREIDDIWNHCIICNELIREAENHIKTVSHIANLEKGFIDTSKNVEAPIAINEAKLLAIDDTTSNKAVNTIDIVPSKKERKIVVEQEKSVKSQKEKVNFDIDSFSNTLTDKLLPFFAKHAKSRTSEPNQNCQGKTLESENSVKISNTKENTKNEVQKLKKSIPSVVDISISEPKIVYDEIDSNNSNPKIIIGKYCTVCRIHVPDFEIHKISESHAEISNRTKELRLIINKNNLKAVKDNFNSLKCEICDVNINYESTHINEHINSQIHKRNYFKYIELNKIILIDQTESQCEPCNKHMHRSNIFDHCKLDKHVKKLKDYISIASSQTKPSLNQKETKSKQSSESKTVVHKDIDVTKILYHFRAQDVEYLCKTCHVLISRNASSLKGHVESKQHIDKYNTLIRSNRIIRTAGSFYCEACDEKIPMSGEIIHIYSSSHSDKLYLKVKDTTVSKTTSVIAAPIASTSITVPISKELTIPLYVKYQYKGSDNNTTCVICDEQVQKRIQHMTSHANLPRHNYNFNLIMIKNAIKIKDNMYFCVFCETRVPVFGEVEHIRGKLHLKNITSKKDQPVASKGPGMLTYDHVLSLTQGKRMVKF